MKKLLVISLAAVAMVVFVAGPAFAETFWGLKSYQWPAHCTELDLYAHTWLDVAATKIDGRMDFHNDLQVGCTASRPLSLEVLGMWQWDSRNGGAPVQKGSTGYHLYDVAQQKYYHAIDTTSDWGCGSQKGVKPGDSVWTEAQYDIQWFDGTRTAVRDDNSNAWTVTGGLQCTRS